MNSNERRKRQEHIYNAGDRVIYDNVDEPKDSRNGKYGCVAAGCNTATHINISFQRGYCTRVRRIDIVPATKCSKCGQDIPAMTRIEADNLRTRFDDEENWVTYGRSSRPLDDMNISHLMMTARKIYNEPMFALTCIMDDLTEYPEEFNEQTHTAQFDRARHDAIYRFTGMHVDTLREYIWACPLMRAICNILECRGACIPMLKTNYDRMYKEGQK